MSRRNHRGQKNSGKSHQPREKEPSPRSRQDFSNRFAAVGDWRQEAVRTRAWTGDLVEERLQPSEAPSVVSLHRPNGAGGVDVEVLALPPREEDGFYRNLADHLLLGEPLAVLPEEAARNVAVMEAAARSIAAGGRPIQLDV